MKFNEYQKIAKTTAVYPSEYTVVYPTLGLTGEAGEVAEKVKKHIRGDTKNLGNLKKELGDVLWYLSAIASDLDISLEDVARTNLKKLESRLERDMIKGSGDNR